MSGRKFDLESDIFDRWSIYQASRTGAEVAFTAQLDNHSTRNLLLTEPMKISKCQKHISKIDKYISKRGKHILARQPFHKKLAAH